jgi:MATE family multidrug resistance protein
MKTLLEEFHALSRLAIPVTLSQLALMGMWVTDVILAGRAGTTDLAGVTLGNSTWTLVIYFYLGICIANQPLIAILFGAKNYSGMRHQFYQSLWMAFGCGLLAIASIFIGVFCLKFLNTEAQVLNLAREYLMVMAIGALAMTLLPVLRTTLEATNQTRKVLIINMMMFAVNLPLDYALVEGAWGFPKLGGLGCAWASVTILWISVIITFLIINKSDHFKRADMVSVPVEPDMKTIMSTLKLGVPIGISIVIELGFFNGSTIAISTMGELQVASHAVAMNAVSTSYIVYMGIGQAITILAAQRIGSGQPVIASRGIWYGMAMTFFIACFISLAFVIFRNEIASLYSENVAVVKLASTLLIWSAFFQWADATQVTALCGLRAYKDTKTPPKYQFVAFWLIGLPLGYFLSFNDWISALNGPQGFWFAMVIVLGLTSFMLIIKLRARIKQHGQSML